MGATHVSADEWMYTTAACRSRIVVRMIVLAPIHVPMSSLRVIGNLKMRRYCCPATLPIWGVTGPSGAWRCAPTRARRSFGDSVDPVSVVYGMGSISFPPDFVLHSLLVEACSRRYFRKLSYSVCAAAL